MARPSARRPSTTRGRPRGRPRSESCRSSGSLPPAPRTTRSGPAWVSPRSRSRATCGGRSGATGSRRGLSSRCWPCVRGGSRRAATGAHPSALGAGSASRAPVARVVARICRSQLIVVDDIRALRDPARAPRRRAGWRGPALGGRYQAVSVKSRRCRRSCAECPGVHIALEEPSERDRRSLLEAIDRH